MGKEEFRQALVNVECYTLAVKDLLTALYDDQFQWTQEGARKQYKKYHGDEAECALAWMKGHFDSIEAAVRAAMYLCEVTYNIVEPLWNDANVLIPEEVAGEKK